MVSFGFLVFGLFLQYFWVDYTLKRSLTGGQSRETRILRQRMGRGKTQNSLYRESLFLRLALAFYIDYDISRFYLHLPLRLFFKTSSVE